MKNKNLHKTKIYRLYIDKDEKKNCPLKHVHHRWNKIISAKLRKILFQSLRFSITIIFTVFLKQ